MNNQDKKIVIITGAGGRVGRVFVENALKSHDIYPVIFTSQPQTFSKITGQEGLVVRVDLKDAESIKDAIQATYKKLGRVDVLINNAAMLQSGTKDFIKESKDRSIEEVFRVNTLAAIFCIKYFLLAGESAKLVINVIAGRAYTGHRSHIDYYASKAALLNATRSFSLGYPQHRFRALILRKIAFDKLTGDSPTSLWQGIQKDIAGLERSRYREVCYGSMISVFSTILQQSIWRLSHTRCDRVKVMIHDPLGKIKRRLLKTK